MPAFIYRLIDGLQTAEARIDALLLWNRSLPVSANVGIIEYNRVDEAIFRKQVGQRYGEEWGQGLEDLARYVGVILSFWYRFRVTYHCFAHI